MIPLLFDITLIGILLIVLIAVTIIIVQILRTDPNTSENPDELFRGSGKNENQGKMNIRN